MPRNKHALDTPHWDERNDLLERGPFLDSLEKMLIEDVLDSQQTLIARRATGFVIGLTGPWGLGKSTVVRFLDLRLSSKAKTVSVLFNPWIFSGRDELFDAFFRQVIDSIGRSDIDNAAELAASLGQYWVELEKAGGPANWPYLWGPIRFLFSMLILWGRRYTTRSHVSWKTEVEKRIEKSKSAVVVIIDELDRVERSEVRAVAQLIKAVGEIKGVSYLIAYDAERVIDSLGHGTGRKRRERGAHYLEKIIQHPIPIRPLFQEDVELLLSEIINDSSTFQTSKRTARQSDIWNWIIRSASTPRDVKRLIGVFEALQASLREEICSYDLLAYSWLTTKFPHVRDRLADVIDKLVDDPSEIEALERARREYEKASAPAIEKLLGADAARVKDLLAMMFPIVGADRSEAEHDPLRISRRQNLVRALYLGNPRTLVSRRDVFALWQTQTQQEMLAVLRDYQKRGLLSPLVDRIKDHAHELPESGDSIFWETATSLLVREEDWISGLSDGRSLIEDLAAILFSLARNSKEGRTRAKTTLNRLIKDGELALSPYIFRRHLFRYGLTKHAAKESSEELIWTQQETLSVIDSEVERYSAALKSGFAIRRLPTLDLMYAIGNLERWTAELKQTLTEQLQNDDAVRTFAALTVPPGWISDKATLDEFIDTELVRASAQALMPLENNIPDLWVRVSVRRLLAVLNGEDATFISLQDDPEPKH